MTSETRYRMILRDYGYNLLKVGDKFQLERQSLPGYYPARRIPGLHRTAMGAAESLIPIIEGDEYMERVQAVGNA